LVIRETLMALSLSCPCGARFEVEESLARQTVSCPECQRPVQAPAVTRRPLRTSAWAVAGTVTGLVLAFTGIGTLLALVFGILALLSISRHRGQVAGTGYAIFSIAWGVVFTGLFLLAVVKGEVFGVGEGLRESMMGKDVERGGPMEVQRKSDNYAITRPSAKWYVGKPALADKLVDNANDLLLVNLARDAYIDVSTENSFGRTLDAYRDEYLGRFRDTSTWDNDFRKHKPRLSNLSVRENKPLPNAGGLERAEILLDVRVEGAWITFLIRLNRDPRTQQVYAIRAWAQRRRFTDAETEMRQALDSFRLLNRDAE
jgi:hypothetical protein